MKNTYVHIEVVRQGNIDERDQITLSDFKLIEQALVLVQADSLDSGGPDQKAYAKLAKKMDGLFLSAKSK